MSSRTRKVVARTDVWPNLLTPLRDTEMEKALGRQQRSVKKEAVLLYWELVTSMVGNHLCLT